jgi:hypothetical protein
LNNTTGPSNTATGAFALFSNTTGSGNTAIGGAALQSNTTGGQNTALGYLAGGDLTTGDFNVAVGENAGGNLSGSDSNNVDLGYNVVGVASESNTIRIGNGNITGTYISGISGQTAAGGAAVFVNANGKLGTMTSSKRFKDEIKPMGKASEAILALKPVTFRYKKEIDPAGTQQFGLVAEDVEKVNADLVVRDETGKVNSVRYEQVNAMLLNEFLKEHRLLQEQDRELHEQAATIAELKSTVALQRKGMEAVVAHIEEQDKKMQRVTDQIELSKPAPQTVVNSQ